ncbi:MAG: HAMP domain-containing histidine kinase [Bacteroidales bacterium]|nr:MAG: HAMP domain-containing histidine kinase [Bacteroidales bacterium]
MKRSTIRLTIILGIISIIGIIVVQVYLLQRNFSLRERQLNQSIQIALRNVAEILSEYNNTVLPYENVVYQYSSNYYLVNVNDIIDAELLEYYLIKELNKININLDFEYGIYDCYTDEMVYGDYIHLSDNNRVQKTQKNLPKYDQYIYYFGVYFPERQKYVFSDFVIWYILTAILLIVIIFFGYSQFVIMKQKQLSEIQKDFIDNLTHEFKTPITSLKLSAEVLSDREIINEPARIGKYVNIINEQSQKLLDQVDNILQMTNTDIRKLVLKKQDINLHEVIKRAVDSFSLRLKNSKGQIRLNLNAVNPVITADENHLTNLLFNLIDNSLKYTVKDPQISIQTNTVNNKIVLNIIDNGIGIPREYYNKVFRKFYRIPTGNIYNVKGFGLGLSYVKRIVSAHKWKIKIDSNEGEGCRFIINIPVL